MHEWNDEERRFDRRRNLLAVGAIGTLVTSALAVNAYLDVTLNDGVLVHKVTDSFREGGHAAETGVHEIAQWLADVTATES